MNIAAFLLALLAIVFFVLDWRGYPRRPLDIGLALLTLAWIVQLVWVTSHTVVIH